MTMPNANPFAQILNRTAAPAPPSPIEEKIKALEPEINYHEGSNLPGILCTLQDEQTRIVTELKTLGCGHTDADMRRLSLPRLRKMRKQYAAPKAVESMTREEMIAESCQLHPGVTPEMCQQYPDDQIRIGLQTLRAEASVDSGQTDPPDRAPEKAPVDVAAQAQASAPPDPSKKPKDPARGLRLPEEYGGAYLSGTRKSEGHIQNFLRARGFEVPKKLADMRTLAKEVLLGKEGGAAQQPLALPDSPDRLAAIERLHALCVELGLTWDPASASQLSDEQLIQQITNCELTKAQMQQIPQGQPVVAQTPQGPVEVARAPAPPYMGAAFVLLVDCRAPGATIEVAQHPDMPKYDSLEQLWRAATEFGRRVQAGETQLTGNCYVSTRTPVGQYLVEVLKPLAQGQIITGDR